MHNISYEVTLQAKHGSELAF